MHQEPESVVHARRPHVPREEMVSRRLMRLHETTGYQISQVNGQRIFGPPPNWMGPVPPKGSEVFVGKVPRYILEDELYELFRRAGPIYQIRLMIDFAGMNRGYSFVCFTKPEYARLAVSHFNNYGIRRGHYIGVYKSVDNCRLFVGSIPPEMSKAELREELERYVEGIVDVIMYLPQNMGSHRNRGYVFVEFDCHRSAAMARRLLGSGVKLSDTPLSVDWADPIPDVDPSILETVTKLYVRNLHMDISREDLLRCIRRNFPLINIVGAYKTSDYAFLHFPSHEEAASALKDLQGMMIYGSQIEVSWAKPRQYSKEARMNTIPDNFCTSVPPKMRQLVRSQKPEITQRYQDATSSSSSSPQSSSSSTNALNEFFVDFANLSVNNMFPSV